MADGSRKKSVSISFENVSEAPRIPVNGVWGGVSQDGTVWAALLHEHGSIPNVLTFDVDEQGRGDPNKGERVARGDATRNVQAVAQMSPETAISIAQWLIEKARLALDARPDVDIDPGSIQED